MSKPVSGKRVVVTGGAGGIGTAARERLAAEGASVLGLDLAAGPGIIQADVTDRLSVAEAIAQGVRQLGGLDILVNGAGVGVPQDAGGFPDVEARHVMEVNFFGAWNATAAALPHLLSTGGRVVSIASMLAAVDLPYAAAYCASKRALDAWANVLRLEYGDRLTVVTVYPGYIRTAIHERSEALGCGLDGLAREESLADAARAILAACITGRSSVVLTRQSAVEMWLARHAPALVRRGVLASARRAFSGRPRPPFLRAEVRP